MKKIKSVLKSTLLIMIFLLGTIVQVSAEQQAYDLSVHVIDVGQGLSLLFESDDRYMLYDGGDSEYSSKVVSYLKQQSITSLDYIIASHYDSDHLNGIVGALNVFEVSNVLGPDYKTDTRVFHSFQEITEAKGLNVIHPAAGEVYPFGNASFTILAPNSSSYSDENDYSVAIRMDCNTASLIVTGDATTLSEQEMLSGNISLDTDLFVVGHHGSDGSNCDNFISDMTPISAIISCGEDNSYGHPDIEVMERLSREGISVFRTDIPGDLLFSTDGTDWFISVDASNDYSAGELPVSTTDMYATTAVNVRSDRSTDSSVLGQLVSGEKISVYSSDDEWACVSYNGGTAYIAAQYLSEENPAFVESKDEIIAEPEITGSEITYVLNLNSKKFHYPSCHSAAKIAPHNYGETTESRDAVIARGFDPCGNCHP